MEELKWNTDFMISVFDRLGLNQTIYPFTFLGVYCFLEEKHISIRILKEDNNFLWTGCYVDEELDIDYFSEDFTHYTSFEDAMEAAIVESACYLLNREKNDTHI